MNRLLRIAQFLCGAQSRATVFEPLVADWQREWREAPASTWARARILAGGSIAMLLTMAQCLLTGGIRMPRIALIKGSAVLVLSTVLLVLIQMALNTQQFRKADFPFEMRIWMALPLVLPLTVPLAMLPAMMLMRGAGQVSARAAAIVVLAGGLLTLVTTGWLTPLSRGDVRDSLYEEIERRSPITAAQQARPESPEQRAKRRELYRSDPQYIAYQESITRPRWNRTTFMMAGLAVALGALGWALGGLGRTRPIHAAGWWALTWLAVMILDGRAKYWVNGGIVQIATAPAWAPLAVFATAALALSIAARRRRV